MALGVSLAGFVGDGWGRDTPETSFRYGTEYSILRVG
jgi:hypothetical protein